MDDEWNEYRQQFYSLSSQEQQAEWEKMTPDQRARFESVAAPLPPPPLRLQGSTTSCSILET